MNKQKGRKPIVSETLKNIALNLAETHGLTDKEIASSLGICETTFHNTKKYDPSFFEKLKLAKENHCNQLVEDSLLKRCLGQTLKEVRTVKSPSGEITVTETLKEIPGDSQALTLYLKNRLSHKYNLEKISVDVTTASPQGLTREEALQALRDDPFLMRNDDFLAIPN